MASFVGKPTLSIETAGPGFVKITVTYTASFTLSDLQFADGFADSAALFEDDRGEPFGGDDDLYFNWDIGTFRPTSSEHTRVFTASYARLPQYRARRRRDLRAGAPSPQH